MPFDFTCKLIAKALKDEYADWRRRASQKLWQRRNMNKPNGISYSISNFILALIGVAFLNTAWAPPISRPAYRLPAYRPPVDRLPAYRPPVDRLPAYRPPVDRLPAYRPPNINYEWLGIQPTKKDEANFQSFRLSAYANLNVQETASKINLAFSPDGSFIYLAIFTSRLSKPLYFARQFTKGQDFSLNEFMHGALHPEAKYIAEEINSAIKGMIDDSKHRVTVDEVILEHTERFAELQQLQEIDVASSKPPPLLYRAHRFRMNSSPPNRWFARIKGCCLYAGIPPKISSIHNMEKIKFKETDLRVVNLFESSAVTSKLKQAATHGLESIILSPTELNSSNSKEQIESIFQKSERKTVAIIGHIEGLNTFVAHSADGQEILSVSVPEIQAMADKYQVNLLLLGCYTESAIRSNNGSYLGTLSEIRASRAVEQLTHAAKQANTWADFFQLLSAADLPLVVSNDFMMQSANKAKKESVQGDLNIVQVSKPTEISLQVGRVWFNIQCQRSESGECED